MVRLILVRHGQTPANISGVLDAELPGPGLTDLGRDQATALVDRLAGERITRIVASPLARTVATAGPIAAARDLPVAEDLGLREVRAGDLEGRSDRPAVEAYLDAVAGWGTGDLGGRVPGSPEDGHDFFDRFDRAVAAAVDGAEGAVLLLSHGAAIRVWAGARAANLPDDHGLRHGLPNTGVVVLTGGPGRWRAVSWEDDRFGDAEDDPTGAADAP